MYLENEVIEFINLPEDTKASIEVALGAKFEEILFYFVAYENIDGHEYAVLSAETDTKFAIVNCPVHYLDNTYAIETDALVQKMLVDWALDKYNETSNEAEKQSWLDYLKALTTPNEEIKSPGQLKIGPVINEDDEYEDQIVNDDELFFMPEDE